jgi:hypothetical protein
MGTWPESSRIVAIEWRSRCGYTRFADASSESAAPDHRLPAPDHIPLMAIALKQRAPAAVLEMGPQFLSKRRQYGHVAIGAAFGMSDVNLGRVFLQEQIFDINVNELATRVPVRKSVLMRSPSWLRS